MKTSALLRWTGIVGCALALVLLAGFAWFWARVAASLPPLDGEAPLPGLTARATLTRDHEGVVTIVAANTNDAARALGFAHGQDRFFQMDLLRRSAAGELSALIGSAAVPADRLTIGHRFREKAAAVIAAEPAARRARLEAYTQGVNAGLASLPSPPWEYAMVRSAPEPWRTEDCALVGYALVLDLQDSTGTYEQTLTTLRDLMGAGAVDFFNPVVGPADSALDGTRADLPPPPSERVIDLRRTAAAPAEEAALANLVRPPVGSNAFVLPGDRTLSGAALLASDPHLGLSMPNIWYRARIEWTDSAGQPRHTTGATIPGVPGFVIGSNGRIAWSFTNATVDVGDLVAVDLNQVAPELLYHRGTESLEFEERTDLIAVKGGEPVAVTSTWTVYGPLVGRTLRGKPLAYRWTFHDPAALNFALLDVMEADSVDDGLRIAAEAGLPPLNYFLAGANGEAAWTLIGRVPRRLGYDGRFPVSWTFGDRGWQGWMTGEERPVLRAAPGAALWSGNQRKLGGEALSRLGDSGYDDPERSAQIERHLATLGTGVTESALLAVALDDRAEWMNVWRDLLQATLARAGSDGASGARADFQRLVESWNGRAAADSVAYRLLRAWRDQLTRMTLDPIFAECRQRDPEFAYWRLRYEAALQALHRTEPPHLLAPEFASWDALRLAAVDRVIASLDEQGTPLAEARWGEVNRLAMRHPFAGLLPDSLTAWLNAAPLPQSGDSRLPRVARPSHGASLRLSVSPGREAEGIFHAPGGQSGNPRSPFYTAGHAAWVHGDPTPFLPGDPAHTLTLQPE